jgi:hypothetical protein
MITLIILLLTFHWLADYTYLSTPWMLKAKKFGTPIFPIFVHASIHGALMFIILLFFTNIQTAILLAAFQIITHFTFDTLKGRFSYWFPILQDNMKYPYWIIMGFDQLLHQVVIVLMAWYACLNL